MARQQYQLPGVVQSQPQAQPTNQFVQAQLHQPIPKAFLDLSHFSPTLTNLIAQTQMDAHEREYAQGEMDATYTRPFGEGHTPTPEGEANRKAFKAAQESGQILPTESPWYRIGVLTAEGRRAGLVVHEHLLSQENLLANSQVYNKNGDFIGFDLEDPVAAFERQKMPFLTAPALQSIYGQRAAADIIDSTRAEFVTKVMALRDAQTQQYHEAQLSDQFVEQIGRVEKTSIDKSAEGKTYYNEAVAGVVDLFQTATVNHNVPDPPRVLRNGIESAIERAASDPQTGSPERALRLIAIARKFPVGTTTIGADNSESGKEFRFRLDQLEAHYHEAVSDTSTREARELEAGRKVASLNAESFISDEFAKDKANGVAPSATYSRLTGMIGSLLDGYGTDRKRILDGIYREEATGLPPNPAAMDLLNQRILRNTSQQVEEWISAGTGKEWSTTQAKSMRDELQKQASQWMDDPNVKLLRDNFKADNASYAEGRSGELQGKVRDMTAKAILNANQQIQIASEGLTGEQRAAKMPGIVKSAYADATKEIDAYKNGIAAKRAALDKEVMIANGEGRNVNDLLMQGNGEGLYTDKELEIASAHNEKASSVVNYVTDPRITNMLESLYPNREDLKRLPIEKVRDANALAQNLAQDWGMTKRHDFKSQQAADLGFTQEIGVIQQKVGTMLGIKGAEKPLSEASQPGGPKRETVDQATEGKAFYDVLYGGNKQEIKAGVGKTYATDIKEKDQPSALLDFQSSFATNPKGVQDARNAARSDLALLQTKNEVHTYNLVNAWTHNVDPALTPDYKKALLSTGAASWKELLDGQMIVKGVPIVIAPEDVNPWTTPMFASTADAAKLAASDPVSFHRLAARYKITDAEFPAWLEQQKMLLKANGL